MILLLEDKRFYVYAYLDPRKPGDYLYGKINFSFEPFYIGKGHEERKYDHIYDSKNIKKKSPKLYKINKILGLGLKPVILDVYINLTEEQANYKEKNLILTIGRKDLGKGPLVNLTDGGEGTAGVIRLAAYREKFSKIHKGKILSEETISKIKRAKKGIKLSSENKRKISESNKGRVFSIETREKIKNALINFYKNNPDRLKEISARHKDKKVSEETKQKLKEKRKFQIRKPMSEETKRKIGLANSKPLSEMAKLKMRIAAKDRKPHSMETKIKMSLSQKKRWCDYKLGVLC